MTFTPWQARGAASASALLLAAAFPPCNAWPLALIALVPLLLAVWSGPRGKASRRQAAPSLVHQDNAGLVSNPGARRHPGVRAFWPAFRLGWLFGFVFFTATLWWIQYVTLAGMLALTAYLALYPAVAMGMAGWLGMSPDERWGAIGAKVLLVAGAWCGLEWVRSVALSGFPWNGLAVPFFDTGALPRLAGWIGVGGISLPVAAGQLLLAVGIMVRKHRGGILGILLTGGGLLLAGEALVLRDSGGKGAGLSRRTGPSSTAILIQPNVTMEEKMSPDPEVQRQRYFDLVAQTDAALAAAAAPDGKPGVGLVVWPESAVPGFFDEMVEGGAFVDQLGQGDFTLVTGADHREWDRLYNSIAAMRGNTGNRAIHPKIRLVPFGEFIPFRKQVPLLEKMLGNLIPMDFNAGTSLEPMRVQAQPFSIVPLVCFEDTIGEHARKFIRPEPQVLVNVTNDNWFQESPATEMHFANARWRAVELGRTLIRSANTGVTAIVSPWGEVQRIPPHQPGTLRGTFSAGEGFLTFYARHGDLFSRTAGVISLLGCGVVGMRRRQGRSAPDRATAVPLS